MQYVSNMSSKHISNIQVLLVGKRLFYVVTLHIHSANFKQAHPTLQQLFKSENERKWGLLLDH